MRVDAARPDVTSLMFRLFCRTVHPELLEVFAHSRLHRDQYAAEFAICDAGHLISFHHNGRTVTEIACPADRALPQNRQVIGRRLRGHRNESMEHDGGILYHVSFQVEQLDAEVFQHCHEEMQNDAIRARLSHFFSPTTRLAPAPLSYIHVEERQRTLLVHTFHTFPDNRAVVKTQSLFEV
jgi:hypothetical protein